MTNLRKPNRPMMPLSENALTNDLPNKCTSPHTQSPSKLTLICPPNPTPTNRLATSRTVPTTCSAARTRTTPAATPSPNSTSSSTGTVHPGLCSWRYDRPPRQTQEPDEPQEKTDPGRRIGQTSPSTSQPRPHPRTAQRRRSPQDHQLLPKPTHCDPHAGPDRLDHSIS